jgi:ParB-like chromosome segregation protein Spo0J
MALSFRVHGQLQPIMVRPIEGGLFEGVFGYQRYLAARRAGLQSILCIVKPMSDDEVYEARLVENIIRKELSAMEKAEWYNALVEHRKRQGYSEESVYEAAARTIEAYTGEKPPERTIRKLVYLASKIKKKAKEMFLGEQKIGLKHLEELARIEDENLQASLGEKVAREGWTVQRLKREVDEILGIRRPKSPEEIAMTALRRDYPTILVDYVFTRYQGEFLKDVIKATIWYIWWKKLTEEEREEAVREAIKMAGEKGYEEPVVG